MIDFVLFFFFNLAYCRKIPWEFKFESCWWLCHRWWRRYCWWHHHCKSIKKKKICWVTWKKKKKSQPSKFYTKHQISISCHLQEAIFVASYCWLSNARSIARLHTKPQAICSHFHFQLEKSAQKKENPSQLKTCGKVLLQQQVIASMTHFVSFAG